MSKNIFFKISLGMFALLLLLLFLTKVLVEPWAAKKIEAKINEKSRDYVIGIDKVNISFLRSGITFENLTIQSILKHDNVPDLSGEITSVRLSGINLLKILFRKELDINEAVIFHSCIRGKFPFHEKAGTPMVFGLNIRINRLFFNMTDLTFGNKLSSQTFSVKNGIFIASDLHVAKTDTLSPSIFRQFEFQADEILSVSPDSMYTFKAKLLKHSEIAKMFSADSISVHPNYTCNAFASRNIYITDRIEAELKNMVIHDFSISDLIKSNSLKSTFIEIGNMNLSDFRDRRKKVRHVNKPAFQDLLYNFPGSIHIDSISLLNGNVIYTEHAEQANEPGHISFTEINAKIFKISNDTVYKSVTGHYKLEANALLMGKGKITVQLKGRLFDSMNTLSLDGTLSGMEAGELNPMLENNAAIYVTSGKIESMNFNISADNTNATGEMFLRYHGLNIRLKNKKTNETTAIKEKLGSIVANMIILDANPQSDKALRKGVIDYRRDPEKSLVNYCAHSILSGIKSSLTMQKN